METKEKVKSAIQQHSSKLLIGVIGALLGLLMDEARKIPLGFLDRIPQRPLLLALLLMTILCVLLLTYLFSILREEKLTPKDDVLWDTAGNPHCPACKTLINFTWYDADRNRTRYACIKCVQESHARGNHIKPPNQ